MRTTNRCVLRNLSLALLMPVIGACGGGDGEGGGGGSEAEYCDTFCDKMDECGFSGLLGGRDACISNCTSGDDEADGCAPPDPGACLAAVDSLSCGDLTTGNIPAACQCEGEDDDGGSDPGSQGGSSGASDTSGGCAELRACCEQLPAGVQGSCTTTADSTNDQGCGLALSTFVSAGLCN